MEPDAIRTVCAQASGPVRSCSPRMQRRTKKKKAKPTRVMVEGCVVREHKHRAVVRVPVAGSPCTKAVYVGAHFFESDGVTVNPLALQLAAEAVREARALGGPPPKGEGPCVHQFDIVVMPR